VPPMIIYKLKRMSELLMKGSTPESIGACSSNGWINSELFIKWLHHFIAFEKPTEDRKALLIMGGHRFHKSPEAIDIARSQGLVLICLPPHTTHRMQPLDRTIYGPLKVNYNAKCGKWMTQNAGWRITQSGCLIWTSIYTTSTLEKAISGFCCSGLWPYNVFNAEDSLPSMVTDEPQPSDSQQQTQLSTRPNKQQVD